MSLRAFHGCRILMCSIALVVACGDDDSTMPDAGAMDAPAECTVSAECDDGLHCNGTETCTDGQCLFGAVPDCDDGIACTFDECDEEADACIHAAPDLDGDGARDMACVDLDGEPLGSDCADDDPFRFPGNPEVCDTEGHDEDCDLETIGDRDLDRDGFIDAVCCNPDESGDVGLCGNDCNDARANVNLEAAEACDRVDNDCDGAIDEGVLVAGFVDADRDGFGDETMPLEACAGAPGFVLSGGAFDCDDTDIAVNPGQLEICDGRDNDCDDATSDDDAVPVNWYRDVDGDGFGSALSGLTVSCEPVPGHSLRDTDCNDAVASISPAAAEVCDALDNDCNGLADFEIAPGDFEDDDGDGLVDIACGAPRGVDCDDNDPDAGPGTSERCDGRDNDCDARVDEGAADLSWFFDADGDGHGAESGANPVVRDCVPPPGHVASGADCDDADADVRPGATEVCDMADGDCDGAVDEGGVCSCPTGLGDCDGNGTCETDTTRTVDHCGACGSDCAGRADVGAARCRAGRCEVAACVAGTEDCNGTFDDGCETDVRNDASSCGACGDACVAGPQVATMRCSGGRCRVGTCTAGFGDCNGDPADGCEVDLSNSSLHCGRCGAACLGTGGGSAMCVAAVCQHECRANFTEDCNGDPLDGCETPTDTITDCGDCGTVCMGDGIGGDAVCELEPASGGRLCGIRCDPGFADCDDNPETGCEEMVTDTDCTCGGTPSEDCTTIFGTGATASCRGDKGEARCFATACGTGDSLCDGRCVNTGFDRDNCGACGRSCGGGDCVAGACDCQPAGTTPAFCAGDGCVDLDVDPAHCGGCGVRCTAGERCEGGSCAFDCGSRTFCGLSGCVDPLSDPLHCGGCDMPCGAGERCDFGSCAPDCTFPEDDCGEATCSDLRSDPSHCGRCFRSCSVGANATDAMCDGGACEQVCDPGFADCDGDAGNGCEADLSAPETCGSCDHDCGAAGMCSFGYCDEVLSVSASQRVSCAIRSGGGLACWGDNSTGQLARDPSGLSTSTVPLHIPLPAPVSQVAIGLNSICALLHDPSPRVFCWGSDAFEQLGDGPGQPGGRVAGYEPFEVSALSSVDEVVTLESGWAHACALTRTGGSREVYCWGNNHQFQAGVADAMPVDTPTLRGFASVPQRLFMGADTNCVEVSGAAGQTHLECWGDGRLGQTRTSTSSATPVVSNYASSDDLRSLGQGHQHACSVVAGGLWCWGSDASNQTTIGFTTPTPTNVSTPAGDLVEVVSGGSTTCVRDAARAVYCTGLNTAGGLVDGAPDPTLDWEPIITPAPIAAMVAGNNHQCALSTGGHVYCWGLNAYGQLGYETAGSHNGVLRQVEGLTP